MVWSRSGGLFFPGLFFSLFTTHSTLFVSCISTYSSAPSAASTLGSTCASMILRASLSLATPGARFCLFLPSEVCQLYLSLCLSRLAFSALCIPRPLQCSTLSVSVCFPLPSEIETRHPFLVNKIIFASGSDLLLCSWSLLLGASFLNYEHGTQPLPLPVGACPSESAIWAHVGLSAKLTCLFRFLGTFLCHFFISYCTFWVTRGMSIPQTCLPAITEKLWNSSSRPAATWITAGLVRNCSFLPSWWASFSFPVAITNPPTHSHSHHPQQ